MDFPDGSDNQQQDLNITVNQSNNRVEQLINQVENDTNFGHIDGKVLACAIKMVHYCGVKRKEIGRLRFEDIKGEHDEIINEIDNSSSNIYLRISNTCKILLSEYAVHRIIGPHLEHLRTNDYEQENNSLLFPQKNKSEYYDKALSRNLGEFIQNFAFNDIRLAGKNRFFRETNDDGNNIPDGMISYRLKILPVGGVFASLYHALRSYKDDHGIVECIRNIDNIVKYSLLSRPFFEKFKS